MYKHLTISESPQIAPLRPGTGISPQITDTELVTLAVLQALGFPPRSAGSGMRSISTTATTVSGPAPTSPAS
jgi:hypothetical protein